MYLISTQAVDNAMTLCNDTKFIIYEQKELKTLRHDVKQDAKKTCLHANANFRVFKEEFYKLLYFSRVIVLLSRVTQEICKTTFKHGFIKLRKESEKIPGKISSENLSCVFE